MIARESAASAKAKVKPAADVLRKSRRVTDMPSCAAKAAIGRLPSVVYSLGGRISQSRGGVCPSQPLGEEAQEARRHQARMAAWLVDRIAEPVVRRAMHNAGAHLEFRLLERLQELERLRLVVDHVILGAPDQEHSGLVVAGGRVADRRSVEIDAAVLDRRDPQHRFIEVVAGIAELLVT